MSEGDWFAPKRFGLGAGVPVAWQGWALIGLFLLVMIAAAVWLMPRHPALFAVLAIVLVVPLNIVSARHTRGGWKWRWGGEE